MLQDTELSYSRRVPSLVQLCQRVASTHVENICSLGDEATFELVAPILQNCSPDALLRFEQATPSLESHTSDLWKALCFRTYPLPAERRNIDSEPESWRDEFFILRDLEAQRLEAVGSKLRTQREELEQRKKDSQIKLTDKVPPTKRFRGGWGQPQPPKTLLQKTRADAVRVQKGIYGARMLPAIPASKTFRTLSGNTTKSSTAAAAPAGPSAGRVGTRVTVTAVPKAPPPAATANQIMSSMPASSSPVRPVPTRTPSTAVPPASSPPSTPRTSQSSPPPIANHPSPLKVPVARKDPMASLFIPKHRAYSQLPTQSSSMRSRA